MTAPGRKAVTVIPPALSVADLRMPCGHIMMRAGWENLYEPHPVHPIHKGQGISHDTARDYKQYTSYWIEWCPGGKTLSLDELETLMRRQGWIVFRSIHEANGIME